MRPEQTWLGPNLEDRVSSSSGPGLMNPVKVMSNLTRNISASEDLTIILRNRP